MDQALAISQVSLSYLMLRKQSKAKTKQNPTIVQIEYYGANLQTQVFLIQESEIFTSALYSL